MCIIDRLMEAALFAVLQAALAVFQRAGHNRLAMPLEHGPVDEEPGFQRPPADPHGADRRIHADSAVCFQIQKLHAAALRQTVQPRCQMCIRDR